MSENQKIIKDLLAESERLRDQSNLLYRAALRIELLGERNREIEAKMAAMDDDGK